MKRKWVERWMGLAAYFSTWSTCVSRQVGAVVANEKELKAFGYNGAPSGITSCKDIGFCKRQKMPGYEPGAFLDHCMATHAEQNAMLKAGYGGCNGASLFVYPSIPCIHCARMVLNSGIKEVYYLEEYGRLDKGLELLKESGIILIKLDWNYEICQVTTRIL